MCHPYELILRSVQKLQQFHYVTKNIWPSIQGMELAFLRITYQFGFYLIHVMIDDMIDNMINNVIDKMIVDMIDDRFLI